MLEGDDSFDLAELSKQLEGLESGEWVVDRVLSSSPFETTQLVHRNKGVVESCFVRKVFANDVGLGKAYARLFAAQTAGKRFSHLPLVYDMSQTDEGMSVVTEFVQGETLQALIGRCGPSVASAVSVGRGLCDAMTELHEGLGEPVVHRDLKPSNIMLSGGNVVLVDLGIARTWNADGARDTIQLGTPGFSPPEQYGYGQTTPQSDIYAAGMVVAYCLAGDNPTPSLRESGFADERIPPSFRPVLAKATALDPAHRFADAREMKEAIEKAGREASGSNPPVTGAAGARTFAPASAAGSVPAPGAVAGSSPVAASVPPAAPPGDARIRSTKATQPSVPNRLFARIPEGVGKAWNVLLILAWLFLAVSAIGASVVAPNEVLASIPLWFRLAEYAALILIPVGLIFLVLMDKRRLRQRFPLLARMSQARLVVFSLVAIVVLYIVFIALYNVLFH